jgi:protein gp37
MSRSFIRRVVQTMEECPQHTFQVLTNRHRDEPCAGELPKCAHGSGNGSAVGL